MTTQDSNKPCKTQPGQQIFQLLDCQFIWDERCQEVEVFGGYKYFDKSTIFYDVLFTYGAYFFHIFIC